MFRSQVRVFDTFPEITADVERLAESMVAAAAEEAQVAATGFSKHDLAFEIVDAHGSETGFAAGIKATKKGKRGAPLVEFFDQGTLGNRKKPLKRPGRSSWTVDRKGRTYAAHRQDVTGKGIEPERFLGKARAAGRRKMLEILGRGL